MTYIVIGDTHGCGTEFQLLLDEIDRTHETGRFELILLGDLFTKGPRPDLVARAILRTRRAGNRVTLLCGNHEIRLLGAIGRLRSGVERSRLPGQEGSTIALLQQSGMLGIATDLLIEASKRTEITVTELKNRFTVVHAGIEPSLGLAGTPDHVKMHIKAGKGEQDWWERYDGSDGLLVFGHKPVPQPVVVRNRFGQAIAVNIDTGCIHGGHLTAYDVGKDSFIQIRSQQPMNKQRLAFAVSPTVAPTSQQLASDVHARTSAS